MSKEMKKYTIDESDIDEAERIYFNLFMKSQRNKD